VSIGWPALAVGVWLSCWFASAAEFATKPFSSALVLFCVVSDAASKMAGFSIDALSSVSVASANVCSSSLFCSVSVVSLVS
jgi:hypothetical protein